MARGCAVSQLARLLPGGMEGSEMTKHLRLPAVMEVTGLARSTIYAQIAEGKFPAPVKLGSRAVAWPETAIIEWLNSRPSAAAA
ncbi:helix-turn-helix transcriptional regulator [Paracoccus saliphilus]